MSVGVNINLIYILIIILISRTASPPHRPITPLPHCPTALTAQPPNRPTAQPPHRLYPPPPPCCSVTESSTGAQLLLPNGANADSVAANTKQRPSRDEKRDRKRKREEAKVAKFESKAVATEEAKVKMESQDRRDVMRCGRCNQTFMAKGWYLRHTSRWCVSREYKITELQKERRVGLLLAQHDELRLAAHLQRKSQLRVVEVKIRARAQAGEPIGIHLKQHKGTYFVTRVDVGSAGELGSHTQSTNYHPLPTTHNHYPTPQQSPPTTHRSPPPTSLLHQLIGRRK